MGDSQLRRLVQQPANSRGTQLRSTRRVRSSLLRDQRVRKLGRFGNELVSIKRETIQSDSVAVMYLGRNVEIGPTKEVFTNPSHLYTKLILSLASKATSGSQISTAPNGEIQSIKSAMVGCHSSEVLEVQPE